MKKKVTMLHGKKGLYFVSSSAQDSYFNTNFTFVFLLTDMIFNML